MAEKNLLHKRVDRLPWEDAAFSHCSFIHSFIHSTNIYWKPLWAKIYMFLSQRAVKENKLPMWKRTIPCQLKNRTFLNWFIKQYISPLFPGLTLRYFSYFIFFFFSLPPYLSFFFLFSSLTCKLETMEFNKAQVVCPSLIWSDLFPLSLLRPPFPPLSHLHYRVSSLHPNITSGRTRFWESKAQALAPTLLAQLTTTKWMQAFSMSIPDSWKRKSNWASLDRLLFQS